MVVVVVLVEVVVFGGIGGGILIFGGLNGFDEELLFDFEVEVVVVFGGVVVGVPTDVTTTEGVVVDVVGVVVDVVLEEVVVVEVVDVVFGGMGSGGIWTFGGLNIIYLVIKNIILLYYNIFII